MKHIRKGHDVGDLALVLINVKSENFVGNLKFSLNDIFIQCDQCGEAAKAVEN